MATEGENPAKVKATAGRKKNCDTRREPGQPASQILAP